MSKDQKFNKTQIANKLDHLIDSVTKKGIFVLDRSESHYSVVDYLNKRVLISEIPDKSMAEYLCGRYNKNTMTKEKNKEVAKLLNQYRKLETDCVFYSHTIAKSDDEVTVDVARMRKNYTVLQLKKIREEIKNI